jgi:hypothetical protein
MRLDLIAIAACLSLCGCSQLQNSDELIGAYIFSSKNVAIQLDLRSNGTYREVVKRTAEEENISGNWRWTGNCVEFESVVVPEAKVVDDLDQESRTRLHATITSFGSTRLDWCFTGEKIWGRRRLVPYPDFPVYFYLKSGASGT